MDLYDDLEGNATHTRTVYHHKGDGVVFDGVSTQGWFVVIDVIESDRPRTIQAFWHARPNSTDVTVSPEGRADVGGVHPFTGQPSMARLAVVPASNAWKGTVIRGQHANATAKWQGWYSQSYSDAWPQPTLVYHTNTTGPGTAVFGWLLVPYNTAAPDQRLHPTIQLIMSTDGKVAEATVAVAGIANTTVRISLT